MSRLDLARGGSSLKKITACLYGTMNSSKNQLNSHFMFKIKATQFL